MQRQLDEDFIESYSEEFAAKITAAYFENHSSITGPQILKVTPSRQVNFFIIRLLFNNWQLESQRLESPYFNYKSDQVREALGQFMNVLSRNILVGKTEFEQLTQDATRDTLFLLMDPNAFMELEMDRRGTETLSAKSATNLIKYIKVAKEGLADEINKNIGSDKDDILISHELITDAIIQKELDVLSGIVSISLDQLTGDETIVVEERPAEEPEEEITIPEIEELSETTLLEEKVEEPLSTEVEVSQEEEPLSTEPEEKEELIVETMVTEPEVKEVSEEPKEEQEETPPAQEPDTSDDSEEKETVSADIITNLNPEDEEEDDEDAILNTRFENPLVGSIAEQHAEAPEGMMSAISLNHRYMFINELFDGDNELFAEAIQRIDNSQSFDESVEMLVQNYAHEFHWDMNSDEVKELLKIIFRRFR